MDAWAMLTIDYGDQSSGDAYRHEAFIVYDEHIHGIIPPHIARLAAKYINQYSPAVHEAYKDLVYEQVIIPLLAANGLSRREFRYCHLTIHPLGFIINRLDVTL